MAAPAAAAAAGASTKSAAAAVGAPTDAAPALTATPPPPPVAKVPARAAATRMLVTPPRLTATYRGYAAGDPSTAAAVDSFLATLADPAPRPPSGASGPSGSAVRLSGPSLVTRTSTGGGGGDNEVLGATLGDLNSDGAADMVNGNPDTSSIAAGYMPSDPASGAVHLTPINVSSLVAPAPTDRFGAAVAGFAATPGVHGPVAVIGAPDAAADDGAVYFLALRHARAGSADWPWPHWEAAAGTVLTVGVLGGGRASGGLLRRGGHLGEAVSIVDGAVLGDAATRLDVLIADAAKAVYGVALGADLRVLRVMLI